MLRKYLKSRLRREAQEDIGAATAGIDDQTSRASAEILNGFKLVVTLQLRTPLCVLEMHGTEHLGPPSSLPNMAGIADARWVSKTKTWAEMTGLPIADAPESESASLIGFVRASGYLPFLKAVRGVMESCDSIIVKQKNLNCLADRSAQFREYWERHRAADPSFPESCLYYEILELDGVNADTARRLFDMGFTSAMDVARLSHVTLMTLPGIGPVRSRRILASATERLGEKYESR